VTFWHVLLAIFVYRTTEVVVTPVAERVSDWLQAQWRKAQPRERSIPCPECGYKCWTVTATTPFGPKRQHQHCKCSSCGYRWNVISPVGT
jgi:DNA-directed RNA polymerase subunit M/transcription elongation factor TFIIS